MFGFGYALVSQLINRLALPGIPLYQPPLGPVGNIVLGLLAGAGLGLLCAWPASAAKGILLGGAAAARRSSPSPCSAWAPARRPPWSAWSSRRRWPG